MGELEPELNPAATLIPAAGCPDCLPGSNEAWRGAGREEASGWRLRHRAGRRGEERAQGRGKEGAVREE